MHKDKTPFFYIAGWWGWGVSWKGGNSSQTDVQCETENGKFRFEFRDIFKILLRFL